MSECVCVCVRRCVSDYDIMTWVNIIKVSTKRFHQYQDKGLISSTLPDSSLLYSDSMLDIHQEIEGPLPGLSRLIRRDHVQYPKMLPFLVRYSGVPYRETAALS